ncbi:MAG: ribosomal protein L7/L12 [Armatimonadetes bacterium]|nr:ribosomal protein L7/L12 [Armatimonadota bacterium]
MSVDEIVEALKKMTLAEAEELVEKLTEAFPKLAEMPVGGAVMVQGPGAEAAPEVEEEPTQFNLELLSVNEGANKVQVIKAVREITNNALGLKEAKEAVENAPFVVLDAVDKAAAEAGAVKLQDSGAAVRIVAVG